MPPAKRETQLSQEEFEELLAWLDPQDRTRAGERYEHIRTGLIQIFTYRGCQSPEELADVTIDRVAKKVHEISGTYVGDPMHYFHGVARNVYREYLRRPASSSILPSTQLPSIPTLEESPGSDEYESIHECLEACLNELSETNRQLLLLYYQNYRSHRSETDKKKKLENHLNLRAGTLRVRVHRIRQKLRKCIENCQKRGQRVQAE